MSNNNTKDEKCNCPTSWFSPHRKSKCLLNNTINQLENTLLSTNNDNLQNKNEVKPELLKVEPELPKVEPELPKVEPDVKQKNLSIYVLELSGNKYYIGKTYDPDIRLDTHFNSNGSAWTHKYKPIRVIELIPNSDNFDEDKYTLKYMEKYGINNVRGGSFCEIKLTLDNLTTIKKMISSSTDKCYICGESGHFASNCSNDYDKLLNEMIGLLVDNDLCFRCYRKGHYATDCYAKTTLSGEKIDEKIDEEKEIFYCSYCDKPFDTAKGATCHENLYCKNKKLGKNSSSSSKNNSKCYKCGKPGHYANSCYANKSKTK